jgi:hypothetical protein
VPTPPTPADVARLTDAEKLDLLSLLADDLFRSARPPRPLTLVRGGRPVGFVVPEEIWSDLPATPIAPEELERRIRTAGAGVRPGEMVRRVIAEGGPDPGP